MPVPQARGSIAGAGAICSRLQGMAMFERAGGVNLQHKLLIDLSGGCAPVTREKHGREQLVNAIRNVMAWLQGAAVT